MADSNLNIINLPSVDSTNTWLRANPQLGHATVVVTDNQSAGRGQRGNSWEATPGLNLTFSIAIEPHRIAVNNQFIISRAVSLAIVDTLRHYIPDLKHRFAIKWPNDIYAGDKKICGILIENTIVGNLIQRSIIGIGLNVNQLHFISDAPNPVSMAQLTGRTFNLHQLLIDLSNNILASIALHQEQPDECSQQQYMSYLWRNNGYHPFATPDGETFEAAIQSVAPDGTLTLLHQDGTLRHFLFKEVSFILPQ